MPDFIEDPDERRMFDHASKTLYGGNAMAHVAGILTSMAQMAPQQGSYGKTLKIMANECAKAAKSTPTE